MRFKNFEIRKCVGVNAQHHDFELVKWSDKPFEGTGKPFCWVVGFFTYNKKEPCWEFKSVGMRFFEDYEHGLVEYIKKVMELVDLIKERENED